MEFIAGQKIWTTLVSEDSRWEVSGKIRRLLEDVGVGVRVETEEFQIPYFFSPIHTWYKTSVKRK